MVKGLKKIVIGLMSIMMISTSILASEPIESKEAVNDLLYNNKYEFRGTWISTVYNLDWPSEKGLTVEKQKEEYIDLLNSLTNMGINAVIVQIRPSGDAFYESKLAPWSEYLTGVQGEYPGYDPLEFMISEAHKRGMEFHAWMNPFRITTNGTSKKQLAANNIANIKPEWIIAYDNKLMLNPGIPEVREYIINVVAEVVSNYEVDAIHFDDYFYPYMDEEHSSFPDTEQFWKYGMSSLDLGDWRRNNINELIRGIDEKIASIKPAVKFGISPFGIWANKCSQKKGSNTKGGVSSYDTLYADTRYWMQEGWIDYIAPQLYWKFDFDVAPYHVIMDWWAKEAQGKNTHLYIGHAPYKIENDGWTAKEIINQLTLNRTKDDVKGSIFFRAKTLQENIGNISIAIKNNMYYTKALIPPMPWLPGEATVSPEEVKVRKYKDAATLTWRDDESENTDYYVIYKFDQGEDNINDPNNILEVIYNENKESSAKEYVDETISNKNVGYRITAVSKSKGESEPSDIVRIKK